MALLLVLPAVALATVLAYAVLENVGSQEQISANAAAIIQADNLAQSGLNYAMYNLQHPGTAPTYSGGYWSGPSGSTGLSAAVSGTFNVSITQVSSNYLISSVGTVTGPSGTVITRNASSLVQVAVLPVQPNQSFAGNGPFSAGSAIVNIQGDMRVTGAVTLSSGSTVSGSVYAPSLTLGGAVVSSYVQTPSGSANTSPTSVTDYRTYTVNGVTYAGQNLTSDPVAGTTLGPTASNPAGIYYALGRNVNLNGVTINGTLIVKKVGSTGGGVVVQGSTANVITPATGYPGLVLDNQLAVNGANRTLTVNGLAWVSGGLTKTGSANTGSKVNIIGSLLIPSSTGIGTYNGTLNLTYNSQNVNVPTFSTQMQVPSSIKVLSWSE